MESTLTFLNSFWFWMGVSFLEFSYMRFYRKQNPDIGLVLANFGVYALAACFFTSEVRTGSLIALQKYQLFKISDGTVALILAFILVDLCYFFRHWVHHHVAILWAFHGIHHSSEEFNLSLSTRFSLQTLLYDWAFFIPVLLVGFSPKMIVVAYAFLAIWQRLAHAQNFPKLLMLEKIVLTPRIHRLHHLRDEKFGNKNFGGFFSVWDRFAGTYVDAEFDSTKPDQFGITDKITSKNPFIITFQPTVKCIARAIRQKSWRPIFGKP